MKKSLLTLLIVTLCSLSYASSDIHNKIAKALHSNITSTKMPSSIIAYGGKDISKHLYRDTAETAIA